jgi:uncharacterized protein (TIGR01244 family)
MERRIRLTQTLQIGTDQPSEADLQGFAAEGVAAIIDLRQDGEPNQAVPPQAEAEAARRFGLAYRHIPMRADVFDEEAFDRAHSELSRLPQPIYVHCATGKRSGVVGLVHRAIVEGLTGEALMAQAEDLGVAYGDSAFKEAIKRYVDKRQSARRSIPAH